MTDEPLTDARLAEIKEAIEQGIGSADYYVGGLCDASAAQELLREVERLRTENAAMRVVVAAVAEMNGVTTDETSCVFCGVVHLWEPFDHAADCPALLAARVMGELSTQNTSL